MMYFWFETEYLIRIDSSLAFNMKEYVLFNCFIYSVSNAVHLDLLNLD